MIDFEKGDLGSLPMKWFGYLKFENGKPDINAILILADIVYWYRPTQVYDEETGLLVGCRNKFKSDLLQKSYQHYASLFGLSKRQVTDAIIRLERRELIKRVFRTLETPSVTLHNVLFIGLNVEKVKQLHANVGDITIECGPPHAIPAKKETSTQSNVVPLPVDCETPTHFNGIPLTVDRETYTEITTKTTTNNNLNNNLLPPPYCLPREEDEEDKKNHDLCVSMVKVWNQTVQCHLPVKDIGLIPLRTERLIGLLNTVLKGRGDSPLEAWSQYCKTIGNSRFLMGENLSGFRVSLDWACKPENARKVLEGAIYDKPEAQQAFKLLSPEDFAEIIRQRTSGRSYEQEWLTLSCRLAKEIGQVEYNAWFLGAYIHKITTTSITIHVETPFRRDWLSSRYWFDLRVAAKAISPTIEDVIIDVSEEPINLKEDKIHD